jgi:ABC-type antimicrobial peptide transport system permease subunit
MQLALVGITVGLAAAAGLTRLMTSLLYDLTLTDLPTFGAVAALLAMSAFVACWVPALWASFIDPNTALRCE